MHPTKIELLERFARVVEEAVGLHARMYPILQREQAAVTDRDALSRILAEKEKLITRIQDLEKRRAEMLAALAEILKCPREGLTLARLSRRIDEPHASRIRSAGEKLSQLVRRIQEANRRNRYLIERHLQLVQETIAFIESRRKPHQVYHRTGEVRRLQTTGGVFSGKI